MLSSVPVAGPAGLGTHALRDGDIHVITCHIIYLLELLGLYFAAAVAVLACGPGVFSIDELIARRLEPDMQFSADQDTDFANGKAAVLEEAVASR